MGEIEKASGQMAVYGEIEVVDLNFEEMLNKVYSWWPSTIGSLAQSNDIKIALTDFEKFYELQIAPAALTSGSRLLVQLDWIVYGAVCAVLKMSTVVRVKELRIDYIERRFHSLLLTVGARQLSGEEEPDGSFDMVELAAYLKQKELTQFNKS